MAAKPFRPATGPYTGSEVLAALARQWDQARAAGGRVSQARLARESSVADATVNDWATGKALPRDAAQVEQVGTVLARWGGQEPLPLPAWEQLLEADQAARRHPEPGPGQAIAGLDPSIWRSTGPPLRMLVQGTCRYCRRMSADPMMRPWPRW